MTILAEMKSVMQPWIMDDISRGTEVERAMAAPPVWMPARMIEVRRTPTGWYPEMSAAFRPTQA